MGMVNAVRRVIVKILAVAISVGGIVDAENKGVQ